MAPQAPLGRPVQVRGQEATRSIDHCQVAAGLAHREAREGLVVQGRADRQDRREADGLVFNLAAEIGWAARQPALGAKMRRQGQEIGERRVEASRRGQKGLAGLGRPPLGQEGTREAREAVQEGKAPAGPAVKGRGAREVREGRQDRNGQAFNRPPRSESEEGSLARRAPGTRGNNQEEEGEEEEEGSHQALEDPAAGPALQDPGGRGKAYLQAQGGRASGLVSLASVASAG